MLRSRTEMAIGVEARLLLEREPHPVSVRVRIMRCEPVDVALPGEAVWRRNEFALGVMSLDLSRELTAVIRSVTKVTVGIEHSEPRVLVLGQDDEVSRLIERALLDADYLPRILTHPRYAVTTAKRIGAKVVIVNLKIDPDFSARGIFDTLRSDPATVKLPIIICARQAWLQPNHLGYIDDKRLRLLLVPFTPEELVMALDRAIDEGK